MKFKKTIKEDYCLPHHPLIREFSTTTLLRAEFDGSAKSVNNVTLNEILIVGPSVT